MFTIRTFQLADLADFHCLYQEIFPLKNIRIEDLQKLPDEPAQVWLAQNESGVLCGFVYVWMVTDEVEIIDLGVRVSERKKHLATQLLQTLEAEARNQKMTKIFLEVRVDNHAALELYRNFGFIHRGVRHAYYADGIDAQLMEKSLQSV